MGMGSRTGRSRNQVANRQRAIDRRRARKVTEAHDRSQDRQKKRQAEIDKFQESLQATQQEDQDRLVVQDKEQEKELQETVGTPGKPKKPGFAPLRVPTRQERPV